LLRLPSSAPAGSFSPTRFRPCRPHRGRRPGLPHKIIVESSEARRTTCYLRTECPESWTEAVFETRY
jgi:hypothetical protein